MMSALVTVTLAAAPLEIRVLEREKPVRLTLSADRLQCGATPLGKTVQL